jgi:hypothetical protein
MPRKKPDRRGTASATAGERRSSGRDRRQSPRIVLDVRVDVKTGDWSQFASVTDLSDFGVFVLSNAPHPVGSMLRLRFKLPDDENVLEVDGEVRSTRLPGSADGPAGMGIEFVVPSPSLVEKLGAYIKRFVVEGGA